MNTMNKKIIAAFAGLGLLVIILCTALFLTHSENARLKKQVAKMEQTGTGDSGEFSSEEQSKDKNLSMRPMESQEEKQDSGAAEGTQSSGSQQETQDPELQAGNESAGNSQSAKPEEETASQTSSQTLTDSFILHYSVSSSWKDGSTNMSTVQMDVTNASADALKGWTLILELDQPVSVQGWNGVFAVKDDKLTVTNADYNKEVPAGSSVAFGFNIGTEAALCIRSATLNGEPCAIGSDTASNGQTGQSSQNGTGQTGSGSGNTSQTNTGKPGGSASQTGTGKPGGSATPSTAARPKTGKQGDDWLHTDGNRILDKDGKQVWITGVNWFGYNTGTNTFDGLWNSNLKTTVAGIADHGFNLIRVPISAELINQWASGVYPDANYNRAYNEELNSMNSLEIFEYFLILAEENGIKVMPDIHSAETDASGHMVNLWYTSRVSTEQYFSALEWMADRYKDNDTIIAYDLKNEPHGKPDEGQNAAIWNNSKAANNWKYVAETAAARVFAKNPNVLVLVEGTEIYPKNSKEDYSSSNSGDYYITWWGGNLRAVADFPIDLGEYQNKLVYSPHDYGPTVYMQPWFSGNYTYESLMKDCWHDNWFFIHEENIAPIHIGEWGGFMREPNLTWMTYMRQLIAKYRLNHTFWCLNANSGDTGGLLLDDFTTWDTEKYDFVKEVLWQENGSFVGLDHEIPLGKNGVALH